jgi:hypothetical protein
MTAPKPERRSLNFRSIEDIVRDVDALNAQPRRSTGAWTPAQNVQHVTMGIRFALDGWPFTLPAPFRIVGRLIRRTRLAKPFNPGINLPKTAAKVLNPPRNTTWDDAYRYFRTTTDRLFRGERMTYPSPLFGPLTHEEWSRFHRHHAALHLSFILPAVSASA